MKKYLLFLLSVFTCIGWVKSQNIADFETPETSITMNVMGNLPFDGTCFEIVDNPFPAGINTSKKVVKFTRSKVGDPWAGFWTSEIPIDINSRYVHAKVYKTRISPLKFKLEGGIDGNVEIFSATPQTKINEWEDIVFDYSDKSGTFPTFAFMPDFADPVNLSEDIVIYFDDIVINDIPPVQSQPKANFSADATKITTSSTVNFSDNSIGIPTSWEWTFQGGSPATSIEKNPMDIQYNSSGNYTVTLKVTNSAGNSTETKTGFIKVSDAVSGTTTIVNFEDFTWGALTYHPMANGSLDVPAAFEIADNPAPDAVNSSASVGKFTRAFDGNPWAGFWANISPSLDLATKKYVHVKVYKTRISPLKFKVEGGTGDPKTLEIFSLFEQTKANAWEDIVFDFSSMSSKYPIVAFMPDFADPVDLTDNIEIYFDDILLSKDLVLSVKPLETNKFSCYPNPVVDDVLVGNLENINSIAITNVLGKTILIQKANSTSQRIDMKNIPSGVYIISVTDNSGNSSSMKLIKK
jgi:PKD repeat protein